MKWGMTVSDLNRAVAAQCRQDVYAKFVKGDRGWEFRGLTFAAGAVEFINTYTKSNFPFYVVNLDAEDDG